MDTPQATSALAPSEPQAQEARSSPATGSAMRPRRREAERITVTLTRKQAENLLSAASNVLGHEDASRAAFPNRRDWIAAATAHDKIQAALYP
jgi:hypothetical protein